MIQYKTGTLYKLELRQVNTTTIYILAESEKEARKTAFYLREDFDWDYLETNVEGIEVADDDEYTKHDLLYLSPPFVDELADYEGGLVSRFLEEKDKLDV